MSRCHGAVGLLVLLAGWGHACADDAAPRPVLAWPSSPLEARVVFDRVVAAEFVEAMVGRRITFRSGGRDGSLAVAGARLAPDGRTVALATDPHPAATRYVLDAPGAQGPITYTLAGVEASWAPSEVGGDRQEWSAWWPHFDTRIVTDMTKPSPDHGKKLATLAMPGQLTIRATIDPGPGPGPATLRLKTAGRVVEAAVGGAFIEVPDDGKAVEVALEAARTDLFLTIETPAKDGDLLTSELVREGAPSGVSASMLSVPWAPPSSAANVADVPIDLPGGLEGGDPARGRAVFLSDESKCATCHRIGTDGREVGPDLTHPADAGDLAALYRSIAEPSARVHPSYVTFTVSTTEGRILAGIVRADGPDAIRITDTEAKAAVVPRSDVVEIQPSGTSIMPVGLAGALGPDRLRDLLAYLASLPPAPSEKPSR
jgi:putative heme-binding domain-containing protein